MNASREEFEEAYRRKLAAARDAFVERTASDARKLPALASQLDDAVAVHAVRALTHRLRGTGGTLGFAALSTAAGALEDAIDAEASPTVVATLVAALHDAMLGLGGGA